MKKNKSKSKKNNLKPLVNFIYETDMLTKTPRSGLWFLGTGKQSVAEHVFRASLIAWVLAHLIPGADHKKAIFLCLIHDLGEGRTSDLNYVHQKYGKLAEAQAIDDIASSLPFGDEIVKAFTEFENKKTIEAKIAKDADQLEWISTLRDQAAKGNTKASSWLKAAIKRLKTPQAKALGKMMLTTHPDAWYFDEADKWFVDRSPKLRKWKK
ncbi:MAG: phosphohydrolase [Candidatus Magasanikbacteria bacterium CG10_big_fil_rev_8_21_14_0_10_36_32]|uniref:5'-deoxynucleotidase n=1 Tax=Candidatus Magasanikbacteria bacterium CG10_big_fil_rev_8_21_14_0_10_36_32 TaxID=1974646 RepID=A0A2M6W5G9_9BACT|nr:MAG: phosphohydrolase [Candidatus Magasanikbacteria bacterium CG10_big_fil_rev_8_21_14_0_10_36_32]